MTRKKEKEERSSPGHIEFKKKKKLSCGGNSRPGDAKLGRSF